MLENEYKTKLCARIKREFPKAIVLHLDPNEIQGIPDLIVLYKHYWMTLEGKKAFNSPKRPNQEYYVKLMNNMSFSKFVYPENEEQVLEEMHLWIDEMERRYGDEI